MYTDLEEKREIVRDYIINNPTATYIDIKRDTKLKVERLYENMKEAYEDAGVKASRTLVRFSKEKRKEMIINYIKKNPKTTLTKLQKDLTIKLIYVFGSIKNAFRAANVEYPIRSKSNFNKKEIISYLKKNPLITILELESKFNISFYKKFKNFKEIYSLAQVEYLTGHEKRKIKKQREVIQYIKNNPNATQWEINKDCNTHVQESFERGIIEAYEKANVPYPYERRKKYGSAVSKIRKRAIKFEEEIINFFKDIGIVKSQIRTKNGIADALVEINGKKYVVEVKDYRSKPVSYSDIKQLNKYLEDLDCNNGILICNSKRKDKIYIGNNEIRVLTKKELLHGNIV